MTGIGGLREPGEERPGLRLPTLTVLYHPDLRRIGARAFLGELAVGREVPVSRHQPELARPDQMIGQPLEDNHISRRPFHLRAGEDGGIELRVDGSRTAIVAQGVPVLQEHRFSAAEIEDGAVLELAGRVVLLLHMATPPGEPLPRFGLIGDSPGLLRVRADIQRVADLDVPVLLRGATGTGKELAARAIHDAGPRRSAPFLGVNLGAIAPTLSASELFGAVRGAFTGSVTQQDGYFRRANGGTLFLDEIGEAPAEVQVMLLRALETGEVFPVGSQTALKADVRVIAATDVDLERKVRDGGFRAPLLHRLSGFEIWLPPLRERRDDIGRLLLHFLRQELARIGEGHRLDPEARGGDPLWLPPRLVARLARFDWPGNVRQLRNVARQLVIGSRGLPRLEIGPQVERLLREDPEASGERAPTTDPTPVGVPAAPRWRRPSEVDGEELLAALKENRWDLKATANALGISRTSLYALIDETPSIRKASDLSAEEIEGCFQATGGNLDAMVERLEVSKKALGRRLREMKLG
ncbi:MAG TPA: sigma-54-dependent Fis family transcriptional regulator [Acidobacteria bacterium]|nr:sigma-54-dependent Fis family transcriptional regulator [Acidobacteriota bacterium]